MNELDKYLNNLDYIDDMPDWEVDLEDSEPTDLLPNNDSEEL